MSNERKKANEARGLNRTDELKETDLSNRKMGRNDLQGDDQYNVRNERHAQPDARRDADETLESFEKMDKDKRARADLGKGNKNSK